MPIHFYLYEASSERFSREVPGFGEIQESLLYDWQWEQNTMRLIVCYALLIFKIESNSTHIVIHCMCAMKPDGKMSFRALQYKKTRLLWNTWNLTFILPSKNGGSYKTLDFHYVLSFWNFMTCVQLICNAWKCTWGMLFAAHFSFNKNSIRRLHMLDTSWIGDIECRNGELRAYIVIYHVTQNI